MKTQSPHRLVMVLVAMLALTATSAQSGLSFGVSLNPIDMVANANVTLPMFTTGEAQHAARAELSYGFRGLPGVSATYLLRDANAERFQTYFGAGAGLAFLATPTVQPVLSLHALAGANYRIAGGLGAYGDVIVGGNSLGTNLRFALGLNYTLGSNQ